MASVDVYSVSKINELIAGDVIGGSITDGNIILQARDGTTLNIGAIAETFPDASVDNPGMVELATDTETLAGVDATRAVTPFGLASIPGSKVQVITAKLESDLPAAYPLGISAMPLTSGSWSINGSIGLVVTTRAETADRTQQVFYSSNGGSPTGYTYIWYRQYHTATGGWTSWSENMLQFNLTAGNYIQTTSFTSYPRGYSRLYYTSVNSTGWDFTGKAGEVLTFVSADATFARQQWTRHVGGVSGVTEMWIRTATTTLGWGPWRIVCRDAVLPDPTVDNGNAPAGVTATAWADHINTPTRVLNLPYDAIVEVEFGAWMSLAAGDSSSVRAGVSLNGADPSGLFGGTWGGSTAYLAPSGSASVVRSGFTAKGRLAAGSHTFKVQNFRTGTATAQVNYFTLRITVLRWAE